MKKIIIVSLDILLCPLTLMAALWLKLIRKHNVGFWHTISPMSRNIFQKVGVFPIIDQYYEPLFSLAKNPWRFNDVRFLPGINFNVEKQIDTLDLFNFNEEIKEISERGDSSLTYSFKRGSFLSGDSEILFNFIRSKKPARIIEIGCGNSTLIAQHAIEYNKKENPAYQCQYTCIEPYENNWLEKLNVEMVRKRVEEIELSLFKELGENDILFIDSSHMLRPGGDVEYEYLQILPSLKSGVIVHIHDIFSPRPYLDSWYRDGINFWNEQYVLEAFLSCNADFEIICALNYLKHEHFSKLKKCCPMLTPDREPGSFWMLRK